MLNASQTASDLRIEAARLKEQAQRLIKAADVLDPKSLSEPELDKFPALPRTLSDAEALKTLTQAEAAEAVLKRAGVAMYREDLFAEIKLRGARGGSLVSFCSVLSRAKDRFIAVGKGKWDLRKRAISLQQEAA